MRSLLLDRDGVINADSPDYIRGPNDFQPIPGSLEAIARANNAGFRVIVVSNQSGIGRGLFGMQELNAIHAKLVSALVHSGGHIDAFFFCPHKPDAHCQCRKPAGGLLETAQKRLGVSFAGQPFVGDRESDALAARAVGAMPVLVETGLKPPDAASCNARVYPDLARAVDALI